MAVRNNITTDCHTSYNNKTNRDSLRHLKIKETNQIGKACSSRLRVLTKISLDRGPVLEII